MKDSARIAPSSSKITRRSVLGRLGAATGTFVTASLAGCSIPGADHATYWSDSRQLDVDYEAVMAAAREAGYEVDEPYYVNARRPGGIHPDGLDDLDRRFGPDYRVFGFAFFHTEYVILSIGLTGDVPTASLYDDRGVVDRFPIASLPPAEWLVDRLALAFDVSEATASGYVDDLTEQVVDGTDVPVVDVDERVDFSSAYAAIETERTDVVGSESAGDGWYTETSYSDERRIATVDFVAQSMRIVHADGDRSYQLKIDRLGGFNLQVRLPVGEEIPEDEYRGVFRRMFEAVGLPPEVVDEMTFEYEPSVW